MSNVLLPAKDARRIQFNVPVQPLQGRRFQPTGFPDLGAATYGPGGKESYLLVESAQSMANRLEGQVWDEGRQELKAPFQGLSYVRVEKDGHYLTSSIVESHRLNSPYILESKCQDFKNALIAELAENSGLIDRPKFCRTMLKYDINSLIHGIFLAKKDLCGGRLRIARALSAFIEAEEVWVATSGGVKNDHVDPSGEAKSGFGNVPFHREEYISQKITAYFCIDQEQIQGYGLPEEANELLMLLALYKVRSFLNGGMRLRTACDFAVVPSYDYQAVAPNGYKLPELADLEAAIEQAIGRCQASGLFADNNGVTTVEYKPSAKS